MKYVRVKNKAIAFKMFLLICAITITFALVSCTNSNSDSEATDEYTILINEYQIDNENTIRDSLWNTPDWIELYNYGDKEVELGDLYLSDDLKNMQKFKLPNVVLEPDSYLLVFASSQIEKIDEEIHANFKLSESDGELFLTTENTIVDKRTIETVPMDVSAGLNKSGRWVYFETPTPGKANLDEGSSSIDIEAESCKIAWIVINEYMSSNRYTLEDSFGESPDWIEIYNPNDFSINLSDYYISDDVSNCGKYRMMDYKLEPNEYFLLYASGKQQQKADAMHVPFALGKKDANIVISSYTGKRVDICTLESLPTDISAGLTPDGNWGYFALPTPGEENDVEYSLTYDIVPNRDSDCAIVINEVMPNNKYGILDADGDTSDWIELYNPSDEDVSLDGFALSDDATKLDKWIFSDGTIIKAKGYLIVFLSDKKRVDDTELHADFALSSDDKKIVLVDNNGAVVSFVEFSDMPGNVSKGRLDDGSYVYFPLPTPNEENTGRYETDIKSDSNILLTDIYISEVSAGEVLYNQNHKDGLLEYIEIHNASDNSINLSGYSITDNSGVEWVFPDVTMGADRYLILQLKGGMQESINVINADMSVSSDGETLVLKNADDVIVDSFDTGYLEGDVSSGRVVGGGSKRYFFTKKTPNQINSPEYYESYCIQPAFSIKGGMIKEDQIYLELTCKPGEYITYTTNGKYPNKNAAKYTEPILIDKDTVVRAVAHADDKLDSKVAAQTYILQREHNIPIVCLSTDPVYLFGYSGGIYANGAGYVESEPPHTGANYWRNWECRTSFEYYDENNELGMMINVGLQIAGQFSRVYDQKSLVIRLRDEYGLDEVYYPLYEDSDVNEYKHILLRNSGQDIGFTKIKDYFIHQSVKGYTDVDIIDGRPASVYINGQYWGLYNIREKQNEDYIASHHDVDKDDITIIKSISEVLEGSISYWNELKNYINSNNFVEKDEFEELSKRVDVQAFMDYIIIQSFYGNYDMGNIKFWQDSSVGQWRPMLFDTDMALTKGTSHFNYIDVYFREGDYSLIFTALFENEEFRKDFVDRYAYFLNEVFTEQKLIGKIDELAEQIDGEIRYQIQRYGAPRSYEKWLENIEELKEVVLIRRELSVVHLQEFFVLSDAKIETLFPWY